MACARCPYQKHYELLWQDPDDAELICVLLRCCAGPEIQLRRGGERLLSEIFKTVPEARARAEALQRLPRFGEVDFTAPSQ
jgi:hypothetical protein